MKEMAKKELEDLIGIEKELEKEIQLAVLPKDKDDSKNAVLEIRAGTGGDEASIFAGDLYKMNSAFASNKGGKTEIVDVAEGTAGG